jgi:hypothetical protein
MADVTLELTIKQTVALYDHLDSRFNRGELAEVFELVEEEMFRFLDARDYQDEIARTDS